jgi:hypothetical protein
MSALPPDSGHSSVQVGCPKSANSGHSLPPSLQPEALSFRFARTNAAGVHEHR